MKPAERFLESMTGSLDKWQDGIGYDLEAIAEAGEADRRIIEAAVLRHEPRGWQDIEAMAALDTPPVRYALRTSRENPDPAVRAAVLRHGAALLSDEERTALLVEGLETAEFYGDWEQRPFFLRFNTENHAERAEAVPRAVPAHRPRLARVSTNLNHLQLHDVRSKAAGLRMPKELRKSPNFGTSNRTPQRRDSVVTTPLIVTSRPPFLNFDNQPLLNHSRNRPIKRPGAQSQLTLGSRLDVLDHGVSMTFSFGDGEQDVQRGTW